MNVHILRTKKLYSDPDFHIFLSSRNGVEFTSFLWMFMYPALRICILTPIFANFIILEKTGWNSRVSWQYIIPRTKKLYLDPDFHIFFIVEKRGRIDEFLVNIYVHRTKKSFPDPDFRKFHYPEKQGGIFLSLRNEVQFASFLWMSVYALVSREYLYAPRYEIVSWPRFKYISLSPKIGVEFTSFFQISSYLALEI